MRGGKELALTFFSLFHRLQPYQGEMRTCVRRVRVRTSLVHQYFVISDACPALAGQAGVHGRAFRVAPVPGACE